MKDEKAVSSFTSMLLPSNSLNFVSNTVAEAAKSWPHPKWNECMLSGKARLASSRTCVGFKALLQASSFIVFRQEAPRLASCQSCSEQVKTRSIPSQDLEGRSSPVPYTDGTCGPTSLDIPGLVQEPVPMLFFLSIGGPVQTVKTLVQTQIVCSLSEIFPITFHAQAYEA